MYQQKNLSKSCPSLDTKLKGSHIRLTRKTEGNSHHVTVPNHDPLKLGTLSEILSQVSTNLGISKEELFK